MSETGLPEAEKCKECGAGLVNLPVGGAVCPSGHGGLYATLDAAASRHNARAARIARLPKAVRLRRVVARRKQDFANRVIYTVEGAGGETYRRIRRTTSSLSRTSDKRAVLVDFGGEAVELVPWSIRDRE